MNPHIALLKRFPRSSCTKPYGVLRPETVVGLARDVGYQGLPSEYPEELAQRFHRGQIREAYRSICVKALLTPLR